MLCRATLVAAILTLATAPALADEIGRYRILAVPLGLDGEPTSALLLDTVTGRTWHAIVDDKGRPRWRGVEFAGGSQGVAETPDRSGDETSEPDADR